MIRKHERDEARVFEMATQSGIINEKNFHVNLSVFAKQNFFVFFTRC